MTNLFEIDMLQSAGIGALALLLGVVMTHKITWLQRFCIPSPVAGGLLFSLITLVIHSFLGVDVSFDVTLKDAFMLAFFTSVGFQSNPKVIKQGGRTLLVMVLLLAFIIVLQNGVPLIITCLLNVSPLIGMAAGSISMAGGHGTAGGFSVVLEQMGLHSALTVSMAAATFGLVVGSMIGGPMAEYIIRHKLKSEILQPKNYELDSAMVGIESTESTPMGHVSRVTDNEREFKQYTRATYTLLIVMAIGTLASKLLSLTGITFPTYFGALIVAVLVRCFCEITHRGENLEMDKIVSIGNVCLSLFLGMAMVSLKLWELESLALPLLLVLVAQVGLMVLITYFIAFPLLGKDYDAAVLVAGICGFGLGATPNAMANMSAVCYKYHYTVKPFLIVPIIGAMFVDLMNTGIITVFLNFIGG